MNILPNNIIILVLLVSSCYGTFSGTENLSEYFDNCDQNEDGKIDI